MSVQGTLSAKAPQARFHIPPQSGVGFRVRAGQTVRVVSPLAEQVADVMAFAASDPAEWLSSGRTIDYASNVFVRLGSVLYSNRSRPMFTVTADTAGRHDFLVTPCSLDMFRKLYGVTGHHPSCFENLVQNLKPYGIGEDQISTTLNLFMNVEIDARTGAIAIGVPSSKAGDYVDLHAEMDLIVGVTACSAELSNNGSFKPIDVTVFDGI